MNSTIEKLFWYSLCIDESKKPSKHIHHLSCLTFVGMFYIGKAPCCVEHRSYGIIETSAVVREPFEFAVIEPLSAMRSYQCSRSSR